MRNNIELLRELPKIDEALTLAVSRPEMKDVPYSVLLEAVRELIDRLRRGILAGTVTKAPDDEELADMMAEAVKAKSSFSLIPVVNATGIVLHTNLGRAPLAPSVSEHVARVSSEFCTLEYNTSDGMRGNRDVHIERLLRGLTGCEAAMAVNNNAAAVLLALSALCTNREVIISRGELVEIGGSFRMPDIMAQCGALLKEVGTTNKTRLADYQLAVTENTGAILKVHTSNFRVVGFAEDAPLEELARLGALHKIPVIYDLGNGLLLDGITDEPTVPQGVTSGADLICFSGDKLLGGPQAGIIIGKKQFVSALRSHPLARALRPDKLVLSALEATLRLYLDPEKATAEIPALRMLRESEEDLLERAEDLNALLAEFESKGLEIRTEQTESQAGGGSAPGKKFVSWALSVLPLKMHVDELEQRLRFFETPIICRIHKGRLLLDIRTVERRRFEDIKAAFASLPQE